MLLHEVRQLHSNSGSSGGLQSATKVPSMPGGMVLLQFEHTSTGIALIKSLSLKNAMPGCVHGYKMQALELHCLTMWLKRLQQSFESRTHGATSGCKLWWELFQSIYYGQAEGMSTLSYHQFL